MTSEVVDVGVGVSGLGSLLNLLASNAVLIESTFRAAKANQNFFTGVELRTLIKDSDDGRTVENLLERLLKFDLVIQVTDDGFELNPHLMEFLKWVLNENDLYSDSHIDGVIRHLYSQYELAEKILSGELVQARENRIRMTAVLREYRRSMQDLQRFASTNSAQILTQTRSFEQEGVSLTKMERYGMLSSLHEDHIKPVTDIMKGRFAEVRESIQKQLDRIYSVFFNDSEIRKHVSLLRESIPRARASITDDSKLMVDEILRSMKNIGVSNLSRKAILLQREILKSNLSILDEITSGLNITNFNHLSLFSDLAIDVYVHTNNEQKSTPKSTKFQLPDVSEIPMLPINQIETRKLAQDLQPGDDLLFAILEHYPDHTLEACVTAAIDYMNTRTSNHTSQRRVKAKDRTYYRSGVSMKASTFSLGGSIS